MRTNPNIKERYPRDHDVCPVSG